MRIIAGWLGGRLFDSPHNHRTHPMSDKVRGALFNMLGDLDNLSVLDAFGGSGALAFEAISRGAEEVLVIENDQSAQKTIQRNIQTLELTQQVRLIKANVNSWLGANLDRKFDVILCDPPYDDLQENILSRIGVVLSPGGIYVLSWPGGKPSPGLDMLELAEQRSYGDAQLIFYRKSV